jgi:hypothetical protein
MATGCTTWNYYDKADDLSLSINDLVAANTVDEWRSIRSKLGISSGKWYWEIKVTKVSAHTNMTRIGIADANVNLELPPGSDANGYVYSGTGNKYHSGSGVSFGLTYGNNDIIGVALDLDNGKIWFSKNGIWQGSGNPSTGANPAYTGIEGTFYAIAGIYGIDDKLTCNFGAGGLSFNTPTDFRSGMCIGTSVTSVFYPVGSADDGEWGMQLDCPPYIDKQGESFAFGSQSGGEFCNSFIRFPAVTVPCGVTVGSATVVLTALGQETTYPNCHANCFFNDVDNVVAAPATAFEADTLALTIGSAAWDNVYPEWNTDIQYSTPDISAALQSVFDRVGWTSDNAVMFLIRDNSSADGAFRNVRSIDYDCGSGSGSKKPELHVTWQETVFDPNEWKYAVKICIPHSPCINEDLRDFPVYINLSEDSGWGTKDLTTVFEELGGASLKIAITTANQAEQCYVEIERWDAANNKAELWVKVPAIPADTDTFLWFYYNSTQPDNTKYVGATGTAAAQAVWDEHFTLVAHAASAEATLIDSTANGNDGVSSNVLSVDSKIGKGVEFPGSGASILLGTKIAKGAKTIEAIFFATDASHTQLFDVLIGEMDDVAPYYGNRLSWHHTNHQVNWKLGAIFDVTTNIVLTPATNYYAAGVWDGGAGSGAVELYIDGDIDAQATASQAEVNDPSYNTKIGNDYYTEDRSYKGILDEIRFSDTNRSAAWIKATYCSNWDKLIVYTIDHTWEDKTGFVNLPTEIAVQHTTIFKDLKSEIAVQHTTIFKDLKSEIAVQHTTIFKDLKSEIAAYHYHTNFKDLKSEIAVYHHHTNFKDLKSEIAAEFITDFKDLKSEIIISAYGFNNLKSEIAAEFIIDFADLKTEFSSKALKLLDIYSDIEVIRCKYWLKTEIKAGYSSTLGLKTFIDNQYPTREKFLLLRHDHIPVCDEINVPVDSPMTFRVYNPDPAFGIDITSFKVRLDEGIWYRYGDARFTFTKVNYREYLIYFNPPKCIKLEIL